VQRRHYILPATVLVLGIWYIGMHRQQFGLAGPHAIGADDSRDSNEPATPPLHPANIVWGSVDHSADGFKIEMPTDVKQIQISAHTENGGTEPVNMIYSNPDAETQFSVFWADNPPVVRAGNRAPNRTLEMARDGALALTQTTLESESRINTQGFPGRDFSAHNSGGGVMNSRLVYVGSRLYMLTAAFPSPSARRDKDVSRFFNSFVMTAAPEGANAAPQTSSKTD
jgi:hypothetical protein